MNCYEIIDDRAFTQDNILVHKLLVTNLPAEATSINVAEYFQKFGKVGNVRILGDGKKLKCVIHFDDPKGAAKALQQKPYLFMNSIIRIGVCGSLVQPEGQELLALLQQTKNNFKCNSANTTDQKALILTLNDDCLEHICKYLSTDDQINFALTCRRFYDILIMLSKVQYATLDTSADFKRTLFKTRIFLQIVGSQIKTLKIMRCYKSESNLYGLFCTNVEKLKVNEAPNTNSLYKLISKMHLLQDLKLAGVTLNADFIQYLVKFKHLNNLNIMGCCGVSGENISLLCGVEKLWLNGVYLTSYYLKDMCKKLKKLNYLEIAYICAFLQTEDYEHLSKHLLQLQTLKLDSVNRNINLNCIANLPKLKNLQINDEVNEEFLSKLNAEQLEELSIELHDKCFEKASLVAKLKKLKLLHFKSTKITDEIALVLSQLTELKEIRLERCYHVTDNAVLKLLENCLKLEKIHLFIDDNSFTPALPLKALKLLQEQRAQCRRKNCVEVTFEGVNGKTYVMDPNIKHKVDNYQHVIILNDGNIIDNNDTDGCINSEGSVSDESDSEDDFWYRY